MVLPIERVKALYLKSVNNSELELNQYRYVLNFFLDSNISDVVVNICHVFFHQIDRCSQFRSDIGDVGDSYLRNNVKKFSLNRLKSSKYINHT